MKIWLITDTHFGHELMHSYCNRPDNFEDIILKNLTEMVSSKDVVIHLGDFCFGVQSYWHKKFMTLVCGKKWLVKGNHDTKSNSWYLEHGWDFVGNTILDKYYGMNILFSHQPQYYLRSAVRDQSYDLNIHGHFHNTAHRSMELENKARNNYRQKLLAIEYTEYKPVSLEDFIKPFMNI